MTSFMNGPSQGISELERRISNRLHDHSRLAPGGDGWDAILDRIEHRGRARHRRRAAATGLGMVGIVGALVVLTGGDGTRVSTTPAPPAAGPAGPSGTAGATAGGLPRLALDLPGFDLVHASASEAGGPGPDLGHLLVYGVPGDGVLSPGPVLFARLVPAGAPYGIGDGPEVIAADVAGRPGRLLPSSAAARSLGWPREDGSIVHLIGVDFPDDDLLAAGRAIETGLAAGQLPPVALPGGVELRRETPSDTATSSEAEVAYGSGDRRVELRLLTGGTNRLDDLVRDRLASSTGWGPADVDGRPAVLSTYAPVAGEEPTRTLMWALADGVVAELRGQGLTVAELEAAAASIRPVDEGEWGDLLARSEALQAIPDPGQVESDGLQVTVTTEMCQARNAWLRAREVGDADVAATTVADLGAVLEKGQAGGLGATGDILVVIQRLLDAMKAGDAATVSAIPAGGACS